ncbi:MAG: thiamine pyrophosphate-dependent enzyme [archaeon]
MNELLRKERFPTSWCPGCLLDLGVRTIASVIKEKEIEKNTVVLSGIGCTGRTAGYFNLDSVHSLHGRSISVAEGIARVNPKLNVIVFSGDGDLLGIGGNHLLHSMKRNVNLTVICANNNIYGMTGGQKSPTTPLKGITLTSPFGSTEKPLNVKDLILSNGNFYARTTTIQMQHFKQLLIKALDFKGFSFIELLTPCITNFGRRQGYNNQGEMVKEMKTEWVMQEKENVLKDNELGLIMK